MTLDALNDLLATRARMGHVSRSTIYRLKANGSLGYVKVGGRVFFPDSAIEAYLAENTRLATSASNDDDPASTGSSVPTADEDRTLDLATG